jgi:hypothetical protein
MPWSFTLASIPTGVLPFSSEILPTHNFVIVTKLPHIGSRSEIDRPVDRLRKGNRAYGINTADQIVGNYAPRPRPAYLTPSTAQRRTRARRCSRLMNCVKPTIDRAAAAS